MLRGLLVMMCAQSEAETAVRHGPVEGVLSVSPSRHARDDEHTEENVLLQTLPAI